MDAVASLLPRMVTALAIGAVLSSRLWRLPLRRPLPRADMIQAQMLLCTAAAVITAVIGDSLAKAFGLVGLGGFVRFRSGLKDPRDAAILFLMIGLGMACGHGSLTLAAVGTVFVAVVLIGIDLFSKAEGTKPQKLRVLARSHDLHHTEAELRKALGERNVLVTSCAVDYFEKKLELEVEEQMPGGVAQALSTPFGSQVQELRWTTLSPKGQQEERV